MKSTCKSMNLYYTNITEKRNQLFNFFGFFLCLIILSCDCYTEGNGVVMDKLTNQPIDSVVAKSYIGKVHTDNYAQEMITDESGQFYGTTGNTGRCIDLLIELSKKGYFPVEVTNPMDDTIRLIRE